MSYTPTIGLEVHAELKTKTKMFCGCRNNPHAEDPNTYICPVCLAQPGSLPVPNKKAIKQVLLFGEAVGAQAAVYSEFDRKNYFYPDIPKAYQISQYAFPFLTAGSLADIELTRVHLEEDTARSRHDKGNDSLVDFNRAGVPLMELVTEPVIHDAAVAGNFARELQLLLRTLGISDANMEKGEMRVEANISISKDPKKLGTKVEVKNLNSFKSVEAAIAYEVDRQAAVLEQGGSLKQETRGWDENKNKTFSQRSKETAKDYRYFPDPDILKMNLTQEEPFSKNRLSEIMPILPNEKRTLYKNLGLTSKQGELLLTNKELEELFVAIKKTESQKNFNKLAANYLLSDVLALSTESPEYLQKMQTESFVELIEMLEADEITSRVAKDLLTRLVSLESSPRKIAEEEGLLQKNDQESLKSLVKQVLQENESAVAEYRSGKEAALKYLVGQGMKLSKGTANPGLLAKALKDAL